MSEVLDSGYLTQGQRAAEFEKLVARHVGASHCFATSSATTGLHLTLEALRVGPGDEVVVPDFSFPATANAVIQSGATPRFVDIEAETFNIDPAQLESAITPRTRAIMPVHAFGLCADMDEINKIAMKHGLSVVEDAACALGSRYHGRSAGTLADAGVFSFHPRKIITTGEGGMISTRDESLADRLRVLRTHGAVRGELYLEFIDAGFNYRLSDIHAALGIVQMARLDAILATRRGLAASLAERLKSVSAVTAPTTPTDLVHSFQSFVVLLEDGVDRDAVIRRMAIDGIETTLGTYAMHVQPYFKTRFGATDDEFPNSTRAHFQALTLPLHPQLTDQDLDDVADSLNRALAAQE